jgi:tRNA U38,U39,U40 pseudouridine synthase TruA
MIRRLTGALLEVASRPNLPIDYLKKILATHNPEHTLPTAPSKGLVLVKIKYKDHS